MYFRLVSDGFTHVKTQMCVCVAGGYFLQFLFATLGVFQMGGAFRKAKSLINASSLIWQMLKAPLNPSEVRE